MKRSVAKVIRTLGWKVKKLRKRVGLTQEELADQLKISRVYMGYIEQGRETPSLTLLLKIAKKFDVEIAELFKRRLPQ